MLLCYSRRIAIVAPAPSSTPVPDGFFTEVGACADARCISRHHGRKGRYQAATSGVGPADRTSTVFRSQSGMSNGWFDSKGDGRGGGSLFGAADHADDMKTGKSVIPPGCSTADPSTPNDLVLDARGASTSPIRATWLGAIEQPVQGVPHRSRWTRLAGGGRRRKPNGIAVSPIRRRCTWRERQRIARRLRRRLRRAWRKALLAYDLAPTPAKFRRGSGLSRPGPTASPWTGMATFIARCRGAQALRVLPGRRALHRDLRAPRT